jgi:hypothetical protein
MYICIYIVQHIYRCTENSRSSVWEGAQVDGAFCTRRRHGALRIIQGGSNTTGTDCV